MSRSILKLYASHLVVGSFLLWILAPLLFMVYRSFSSMGIVTGGGTSGFVGLSNYRSVLKDEANDFYESLGSSVQLASTVSLLSLALGLPAAYGLARLAGRTSQILGGWIFSTRFLPPIVAAIPLFIIFRQQQLVGPFLSLVLANLLAGLPFSIWVLKSYIEDLPSSLESLARLDGLNGIYRLNYVILPNLVKPLATTGAMVWLFTWNEYLFALLFGDSVRPLTVLIASWRTYRGVQWGEVCAAGVLAALPAVTILLLASGMLKKVFAFAWNPDS